MCLSEVWENEKPNDCEDMVSRFTKRAERGCRLAILTSSDWLGWSWIRTGDVELNGAILDPRVVVCVRVYHGGCVALIYMYASI